MSSAVAKEKSVAIAETALSDPAYLKIRDLIYRISGIYHAEQKLYLLISACARRMTACGTKDSSDYLEHLIVRPNRDAELHLLLNEITIGETYMFRHPAQLDALHNVILPQAMEMKSSMGLKRLRFWSAGCSTGEEPYTLAMFLLEEKEKQLAGWTFEILATDLNSNSLETARAGVYGEYALRNTSDVMRKKYFTDVGNNKLQASDLLKAQIGFDRVNLSDEGKMPLLKGMDVIFCCNVLIYFDLASKRRVVQHFCTNLISGGYFFMGHAESLFKVDDSFKLVHFPGTTAYWKPRPGAGSGGNP